MIPRLTNRWLSLVLACALLVSACAGLSAVRHAWGTASAHLSISVDQPLNSVASGKQFHRLRIRAATYALPLYVDAASAQSFSLVCAVLLFAAVLLGRFPTPLRI